MTSAPCLAVAAAAVLMGAIVVAVRIGRYEVDAAARDLGRIEPVAGQISAKSSPVPPPAGRATSRLKREVDALELDGVREALPAKPTSAYSKAMNGVYLAQLAEPEREELLFQRLGFLEGRAALDEISRRYGSGGYYTMFAMTHALAGWIAADHKAAVAAFEEMSTQVSNARGLGLQWNGKQIMSGFG